MAEIVLTADKTLMSNYHGGEFLGFAACAPAAIPEYIYEKVFCPPAPVDDDGISAKFAPCGLRRIEAALLENGFSRDEIVVVRPDMLDRAVDERTKVLGVSTNDPLGLGPASSTFSNLAGKEPFNAISFRRLMRNPVIRKHQLKVIVGGPGAWQLEDERIRMKFGIDCVLVGEGELVAPELFKKAVSGEELPRFVHGEVVPLEKFPKIKGATVNGLVEIARGCGRGCKFCNPTMLKFRCLPLEHILEEVRLNLRKVGRVLLHAEDVLRYKANGVIPNEQAVIELFEAVKRLYIEENRPLDIGISHFALASVVAKPALVRELSEVMEVGTRENPWASGQTGIETASERLVEMHMQGKVRPFKPEEWREVVLEAHEILKENHWVPCSTLVMGLPKEGAKDVLKTIELVEDLRAYKSLIVPLFFVPIGNLTDQSFFTMKKMLPEHWMLFAACLKHDFKWVYTLIDEYFRMTRLATPKVAAIKFFTKYMERKLKPYIKDMEQGLNPLDSLK